MRVIFVAKRVLPLLLVSCLVLLLTAALLSLRAGIGVLEALDSGTTAPAPQSADLRDQLWVAVDLSEQKVEIYRGGRLERSLKASTGKAETPTPVGVYRIHGRGNHFYSYRYGEGAYYWVRFKGNYLFHSVPVDKRGRFIPQEAEKLGTPASHGCVRLSLADAKWFFENIPDGTLVIIHGQLPAVEGEETAGLGAAKSRDYLRVGLGSDPITLDPHNATDNISQIVNYHLYETLVTLTARMELVPGLAQSWWRSRDGLTWTFHLRPGVRFHNGTPLDAEEVVKSFQRLLDPENRCARRSILAPYVADVRVAGPLTVEFRLKYPQATFLYHLTHGAAAVVKDAGGLTGTGPFVLEDWVPGNHLSLRRNPSYWQGTPRLAGVRFVPVWDNASRVILLEGSELDVIYPVPAQDVKRLERSPKFTVRQVESQRIIYLGINNRKDLFQDRRVRKALNYAVDREAIVNYLLFGLGRPLGVPVASSTAGYAPVGGYSYDPAKARELLREAGVPGGTELSLWTPVGRYLMDIQVAEAVAGYLEEVGFRVRIERWEWGAYLSRLREERAGEGDSFDLYLMGWVPATGQADWVLRPLLSADSPSNESGYSNPELDRVLIEAETETGERRATLLRRAQEIVVEDAPWIFLFNPDITVAHRQEVGGIGVHPLEILDFRKAFVGTGGEAD